MPLLKLSSKWPKSFGFDIAGYGPAYVSMVERRSHAYRAGLLPGDQILELDGQDVSSLSASVIKSMARHSRTQPPTLGVVSRLHQVEITPNSSYGFGFSLHDEKPVTVSRVLPGGPAHQSGLRPGDIVMEMNGTPIVSGDTVRKLHPNKSGRLILCIVPVGKIVSALNDRFMIPATGSRVQKARDLFSKMNEILGEDYEKKMAVVGVLKQYAEDRDIDMFCRALTVLLKSPQNKQLLIPIRQFVPIQHKPRYDEMLRQNSALPYYVSDGEDTTALESSTAIHKYGHKKQFQVLRHNGSFGFTIKGSNPVHIQTVDMGAPADIAGLQAGDYIIKLNGIDARHCNHDHLVHLLQDSGMSPMIEVLRCMDEDGFMAAASSIRSHTMSSMSSHASIEWATDVILMTDKDGQPFRDRIEYLLTPSERSRLKKAISQYDNTRNVVALHDEVSQILDTPSKSSLWLFLIPRMPAAHQEFCTNKLNIPNSMLAEVIYKKENEIHREEIIPVQSAVVESQRKTEVEDDSFLMMEQAPVMIPNASFKQQLDYLLTSREMFQLKKALQIYAENKKLDNLIEDLEVILDTPSKRTLWSHIIPLLTKPHQEATQLMLKEKDSGLSEMPMKNIIFNGSSSPRGSAYNTDDEFNMLGAAADGLPKDEDESSMSSFDDEQLIEMMAAPQEEKVKKTRSKTTKRSPRENVHEPVVRAEKIEAVHAQMHRNDPPQPYTNAEIINSEPQQPARNDQELIKELEETRKAVKDARDIIIAGRTYATFQPDRVSSPGQIRKEVHNNIHNENQYSYPANLNQERSETIRPVKSSINYVSNAPVRYSPNRTPHSKDMIQLSSNGDPYHRDIVNQNQNREEFITPIENTQSYISNVHNRTVSVTPPIDYHRDETDYSGNHTSYPVPERDSSKKFITIIPVGYRGLDSTGPFHSRELNSPEFHHLRKENEKLSKNNVNKLNRENNVKRFSPMLDNESWTGQESDTSEMYGNVNNEEQVSAVTSNQTFTAPPRYNGNHKPKNGMIHTGNDSDSSGFHNRNKKSFLVITTQERNETGMGSSPVSETGSDHNGVSKPRKPLFTRHSIANINLSENKNISNKRHGREMGFKNSRKQSVLSMKINEIRSSSESETEQDKELRTMSIRSGDSFNRRAIVALKELDAAVAAEVSDLENSGRKKEKSLVQETSNVVHAPVPIAPPPPPPPMPTKSQSKQMNVKRINWEKLEEQNMDNTVWKQNGEGDFEDVLKYLELEQHFGTKVSRGASFTEKKKEDCILSSKKAYNISILLGHLKLSTSEIKQALYMMDEDVMTPELLKQLLAYAPNKTEIEQYDAYSKNIENMSKPDQFAYEMSRVAGYEQRLKALFFKANFAEKVEEMKENLRCIRKASQELKHSKKLAKILELILAMGNYMNKGNDRVGSAAGFHVSFLSQMDITKTSDNKSTFLHVLVNAVYTKFPNILSFSDELSTVGEAAKVSNVVLNQELQELRKVLQDISNTLDKFGPLKSGLGVVDKFQTVMGHFISQASDEIQSLFRLQASTMEEYEAMVNFFGEDPRKITTSEIFGIFAEFILKFERAHRHNIMYKRH